MKTKIVNDDFSLDISSQPISIQEENSKVNDKLFSKFMFPFTIPLDANAIAALGDYASYESVNNLTDVDCWVENEDRVHRAKLEVLSVKGKMLTGQVDFGLEELPNFNKKLSELPLQKFSVDNIHTYAPKIFALGYPDTNFNFPLIYTKKYDPEQEVWSAFDGYLNDNEIKDGETRMRENYIDAEGNIFNTNIIHPCPHILYLLKTGFKDAGFVLTGDVLTDGVLSDSWVYSGTDYFNSRRQRRYQWQFDSASFDWLDLNFGPKDYAYYEKHMTLEKPGKYKIAGKIGFFKAKKLYAHYIISLNDKPIWSRYGKNDRSTISDLESRINVDFTVDEPNSILKLYIVTQYHIKWTHEMADLLVTSDALQDVSSADLNDDSGFVVNSNEIDLTRAVPEMTFGELVTTVKNWFNYDIDIVENRVITTNLNKDNPFNAQDYTEYEVAEPERNWLKNKSFLLKFPEADEKLDSMYFDKDGPLINGAEKQSTTIIDIRGYSMRAKQAKPNGKTAAIVLMNESSTLQLVNMAAHGDNTPFTKPIHHFPMLFQERWAMWLRRRLSGVEFKWSFYANIDQFARFSIKDYIKAYKNVHIIKSWTKEKVSKNTYRVEVTTETVS